MSIVISNMFLGLARRVPELAHFFWREANNQRLNPVQIFRFLNAVSIDFVNALSDPYGTKFNKNPSRIKA